MHVCWKWVRVKEITCTNSTLHAIQYCRCICAHFHCNRELHARARYGRSITFTTQQKSQTEFRCVSSNIYNPSSTMCAKRILTWWVPDQISHSQSQAKVYVEKESEKVWAPEKITAMQLLPSEITFNFQWSFFLSFVKQSGHRRMYSMCVWNVNICARGDYRQQAAACAKCKINTL